ncbi:Glycoside hydrolase family 61 protein [Pleurostoma richardsiae]|uniref:lytic cellulose monooxygenase (C4-dehydrogenating) n=1 Tax=Pleurostoma richardsiae TaxID=41990 RepID=A0AA38S4G8_9PEZI|nr:Glycoside hydrolase family 61 protein [Pleurostoma richardsiae]
MKAFSPWAGMLALCAAGVSAHYRFNKLALGSTKFAEYEHIRQNTNWNSPVTSLSDPDLRCNVGGASGANTTTVDVKAGDPFTFSLDQAVYHQGPVSLFMSKAPGKASEYDGSGNWFKINDWLPTFGSGGATWPMYAQYTYNIPKCIADGEYLLRIQSLGIHNPGGTPQFYISCAQVHVTGGGSTVPATGGTIPGLFKATDPGYTVNIYNPDFKSYIAPGGSVFAC